MRNNKLVAAVMCLVLTALLAFSVSAETEYAAKVGDTGYATVAEAVAAANGETVTLLADSAETVTASGDLYLDLNGHTLAGLTVENGTLYGMDTTTDDYDCGNGYGKIENLTGSYAAHHQTEVADNPQRYLAVKEDNSVSFHRFYVGITHQSLQPANKGVGYKALFAADSVAAAQLHETEAYGYTLWLEGGSQIMRWKDRASFVSEKAVTLRVNNYDEENYGQTQLYASVQLKLTDGTVIRSQEQSTTLKQMVQTVGANVEGYADEGIEALRDWIVTSDTMTGWQVKSILFPNAAIYDMNTGADLVVENAAFAGTLESITVQGTELTLKNATLVDGVLTIPAASFVQKTMPSGTVTLQVKTDRRSLEFDGKFTWVIRNWNDLATSHNHLIANGSTYTGLLALGDNVQITGKMANFTIFKQDTVFDGSFDGRGYAITHAAPDNTTALFGTLGENGTVKDLSLLDVQISTYSGGVAYICRGTVENVYVEGAITGDGMGASSNLGNFGCGLLAGQYHATAKVRDCIVHVTSMAENLRLATAFGQLRQGVPESIFENCYATGADACTFMQNTGGWTKKSFTEGTSNGNFTTFNDLCMDPQAGVEFFARRPLAGFTEIDNHDYTLAGAVHSYDILPTEQYLVQNGKSSYKIVYAQNAAADTQTAATEFAGLFRGATGVRIGMAYAENVTYTDSARYIVIGENALSLAVGVTGDDLGDQGFHIKTVGNSIFVMGANPANDIYGVYELLYQLFRFDCFGANGYSIDKGVKNVPLMNYDITDIPDISIRRGNYQYLVQNTEAARRMRFTYFGDLIIPVGDRMVHNSACYIPKADYPDKTDWFATDGRNLCYTAHGNATELAAMQEIVANVIISHLEANPGKNLISMTQEDTATLCDCDSCTAMKDRYNGARSASVVIFLNKVCQMVEEHFGGNREFTVLFFAYQPTNQPPAVYNETTGKYEPIDENVVLNEHLVPYFAETDGDYMKDFYNTDSANAKYAEHLKAWADLSEMVYIWTYSTNFSFYLLPYNTIDAAQATYKFAAENNVDFIYDQGQANQTGTTTGWSNLKIYLYSKLTWNVDQDRDALIDRFMEGYYGPAADTVKEVFYQWKAFANYQTNVLIPTNEPIQSGKEYTGSRSIFTWTLRKWNWNPTLLMQWTGMLEQAIQELEPLKSTDSALYNQYVTNIAAERIAYNYVLLELFQESMTAEQVGTAKAQMLHDQQLAQIGYYRDTGLTVDSLLEKWGIIEAAS